MDQANIKLVDFSENKDFKTLNLDNIDFTNDNYSASKTAINIDKIDINSDDPTNLQVINLNNESESHKSEEKFNTLNEPITHTLKRDLIGILTKVKFVLNPYLNDENKYKQLRNCIKISLQLITIIGDLWGPLLLTILLAFSLAWDIKEKGTLFVLVFTIFWFGGIVVTVNAQLLGVKISIFQVLCLLGYCLFPLNITTVLFKFVINLNEFFKLFLVLGSCIWSTYSCVGFLRNLITEDKKLLVIYPVVLFYLFLSFFVLTNHKSE